MSDTQSSNNSQTESDGKDACNKRVHFHTAKTITDRRGYIFNENVLEIVNVNDVVRVSLVVKKHVFDTWSHDSPYIKIIEINKDLEILGEVQDIYRDKTDKYPIKTHDRIWFNFYNIIEIPTDFYTSERKAPFVPFLTEKKVTITGPLYTIESEPESDSDTDSESSASESDDE